MGTLENERPSINLDVVEVSSGAVNPSNKIHFDHDRDDLRDHKGIDTGSEDATDPDANLLPDGGREDRSSDYCSSEQVLIEKLQTVGLEGEEEEEDEVKAGEGEIGSVGLEGGAEVKVEEKVEELEGEQEDNKSGYVDWGRLDDEKADYEEEWKEYGIENAEEGALPFPLRPGAEDCSFYMKTGSCKFGPNCKFNHPLSREKKFGGGKGKENGMRALSDDPGKMECKFYLTPGGCKFGDACKYDHSKTKTSMGSPELNFLGLPIRPGGKKCPFYLRTGSCGYGSNCQFDHPDPTATVEDSKHTTLNGQSRRNAETSEVNNVGEFAPLSAAGQSMSMSSSLENSPSYMPYMNSHSQGVSQVSDWNHYQPHFSENTMNPRPAQVVTNSFKRTSSPGNHLEIPTGEEYPERPGLPECDYFMKTGNCKFRSQCRYHHPKSRLLQSISNGFHHNGIKEASGFAHQHSQLPAAQLEQYPERPGEPECSFFMKTGDCKYKSLCKYHHPRSRTKSNVSTMYRVDGHPSGMATPPALPHQIYRGSDSYPNNLNQKAKTFNKHQQQPTRAEEFPHRPGQPECDYFLKTGKCKYGSNCRYDHPKDGSNGGLAPADSSFVLNEKGLPLRPGANICRNYEQLGICKYGPRCLYDHPISKGGLSSGSNPPVSVSPLIQDAGSDDWGDGWA